MKLNILIFLFLCNSFCFGQKQDNNWYFGDSAGINFNSGNPLPIIGGSINSDEASSVISDKNGNILFYAGGYNLSSSTTEIFYKIWNSQNQVMQNGDTINGGHWTAQGCLILPFPGDTVHYYVFSIDVLSNDSTLYSSIIDLTMDSGLGKVTQKNIIFNLPGTNSEKMQAVKHANGRDWWLILHSNAGNNIFYEYLIDTNGIHGPITQSDRKSVV